MLDKLNLYASPSNLKHLFFNIFVLANVIFFILAPRAYAVEPVNYDESEITVLIESRRSAAELTFKNHVRNGSELCLVKIFNKNGVTKLEFTGRAEVIHYGGNYMLLNRLKVKDYLAAAIFSEFGSGDKEYLKACAVLLRTLIYSEYIKKKYSGGARHEKDSPYTVCARTHCVSYRVRPKGAAAAAINAAVSETANVAMFYDGRPADIYFSACCGGRTRDAGEIFGLKAKRPYLASRICPCGVKIRQWKNEYTGDDLKKAFGIEVADLEANQSPFELVINGRTKVSYDGFIAAIERAGLPRIKSPNIKITRRGDGKRFIIAGIGVGHGAGLCQSGALMLSKGQKPRENYKNILNYYYKYCILEAIKNM